MTQDELEEMFLDVMTEYLPKSVGKPVMKRVIRELLLELQERDWLTPDDEEETPEAEPAADLLDRIEE